VPKSAALFRARQQRIDGLHDLSRSSNGSVDGHFLGGCPDRPKLGVGNTLNRTPVANPDSIRDHSGQD